jgi:hypothetical protein
MVWVIVFTAVATLGVGGWLDSSAYLTQPMLFWAFTAAGVTGTLIGGGLSKARLWWIPLAVVLWRLLAFPILLCSSFVAGICEWLMWSAQGSAPVYPVFLVSIVLLHAGAVYALVAALKRWVLLLLVVPVLAAPTLLSFTTPADLVPLPALPWTGPHPVPDLVSPSKNPYLTLLGWQRTIPQNALLLCSGVTYVVTPPSPWASSVKGALEEMARANPDASTADRLKEHYLAYLSAQPRIVMWR